MNYKDLRDTFQKKVEPSRPNEWDIEDALFDLEGLDEEYQERLLRAIPVIWPISHSLCFSFLKEGARYAEELDQKRMSEWLRRILFFYEEGGLKQARAYMASAAFDALDESINSSAKLQDITGRLVPYVTGLSGRDFKIQSSGNTYTDTETIYVPDYIDYFPDQQQNYLYYKLAMGVQTRFVVQGSFGRHRFYHGKISNADAFFRQFGNQQLAKDIYQLMEIHAAFNHLQQEFPGLIRETADIRRKLYLLRNGENRNNSSEFESFFASVIIPETTEKSSLDTTLSEIAGQYEDVDRRVVLQRLYDTINNNKVGSEPFVFFPFMDSFNFAACERVRDIRVENNKKSFETMLSDFISKKNAVNTTTGYEENVDATQADSAKLQPVLAAEKHPPNNNNQSITLNNKSIELPDELKDLVAQIEADLGELPDGYVASAFGLAGKGRPVGEGGVSATTTLTNEFIPYDEWDYRRHGYRKNWCGLRERTLAGVQSGFIDSTLKKHRGPLLRIRRQFEMMRTLERFSRRRRQGDDIDLDAHIESLGDQYAGLPASEKLFIRLLRNERSISTLFLVDMSNSTEGWVGIAIKEALVLFSEAMQAVGDSYGIYGFSGMRRMRSEVYKIKDIGERYTSTVKERLSAISPKEYTRMGPPIRHLTKKFRSIDTKTKLLIILSDGKPEDYDDYKGEYAIEDTRKALAEARGNGIHTYCITIDKESHDYLEHLFGQGNYTFVQKIDQLPSRVSEIYRLLTR